MGHFEVLPAEVMYQHQHASLPLEHFEGVPQPVVTLLSENGVKSDNIVISF